MKHADKRLLNECIDLYWDYIQLKEIHSEIAKQGATQESKMLEFCGDFPQLSNIKPDILSSKADTLRYFQIMPEHEKANEAMQKLLSAFPARMREILCSSTIIYRRLQKQNNPQTRQLYTHRDCAKGLGLKFEKYRLFRDKGQEGLLVSYKRVTQYVEPLSMKKRNM